jgi:hypothetical protein
MAQGHFSTSGAYRTDPRTEFYRQQEDQRRMTERAVRAEFWLMIRIDGQKFATEDALRLACTEIVMRHRAIDDEIATLIRMACASLWKTGRYTALEQVA